MVFTEAFEHLQSLYDETNHDVIRFDYHHAGIQLSIIYTKLNGLSNQLMLLVESKTEYVLLPIYIKCFNNGDCASIETFIDSERYQKLMPVVLTYCDETGKPSTNMLFTDIYQHILQMNSINITKLSMFDFSKINQHTYRIKCSLDLPYFQKLVHKHMSNKMRQKIQCIYEDADDIIEFLDSINYTLSFTDDPSYAHNIYVMLSEKGYYIE